MANMREIRDRISSIQQILKITNAMYLISSSKLKKVRKQLDATEPYFHKLQTTIDDILDHTPDTKEKFFSERDEIPEDKRKKGFVVITADKGLCGSYNHNVLKLAEQEIEKSPDSKIFVLGQVGRLYFSRRIRKDLRAEMDSEFMYTPQNPTLFRARDIAECLLEKFVKHELDEVYVIYTEMLSSTRFEPQIIQVLPFSRHKLAAAEKSKVKNLASASFHPSPETVMEYLIPSYMKGIIYGAMVEAFSCEQQARMTAMDSATSSAGDMIRELSLLYNRARQAAITQEITEVVSGAKGLQTEE